MINLHHRSRLFMLVSALCLASLFATLIPAKAQQPSVSAANLMTFTENGTSGLQVQWGNANGTVTAASVIEQMPRVRFQGYELPLQLLTIEMDGANLPPTLQLQLVNADVAAADEIQPAAPLQPAVIDDAGEFDLTRNVEVVALPTAPAFILRAGLVDGKTTAVLAISPYYTQDGEIKRASQINFFVPGAKVIETASATDANQNVMLSDATSSNAAIPDVPPTNQAAAKTAAKIIVTQPGMQRIPFASITAAGLSTAGLGVFHNGIRVATQTVGSELRFYAAPAIGDRWNAAEIFWITDNNSQSSVMPTRSVKPGSAAAQSKAFEKGAWDVTPEYISRYGGPDGDHWFAATLDVDNPVTVNASVVTSLPAAGGTSYKLNLTPLTRTDEERRCTLTVKSVTETLSIDINAMITGTQNVLILANTWSGTVTSTLSTSTIAIDLVSRVVPKDPLHPPSAPGCAAYFDSVDWERTVSLNFNSKAARFSGVNGTWNYKWSNLPAGSAFYDVTDPIHPVILTDYTSSGFQDGDAARNYAVVGSADWQTPQVVKDQSFNFASITGAHAIYIIAPSFDRLKSSASILQPLVDHRKKQGYTVAVVDVQDIYDAWSYGKVSPTAIRNFLQYTATKWTPKPKSVVLVGDGTLDARNWGAVPSDKSNNINFIPPYMGEEIDPWLGEAACDACYGQLNGTDAVTGDSIASNHGFFDIDVWIGRFPVKSEQDLRVAVNKIVSYETATDANASWRGVSVFMADNYVKSLIDPITLKYTNPLVPNFDPAGNFAKDADTQISRLASSAGVRRVYYDPYPTFSGALPGETWRISNPTQVMPTVVSTVSQGAGIVVYSGHSNHWNMGNLEFDQNKSLGNGAVISESVPNKYNVLQLYDVDNFSNINKYFIQLSMTCLTSQFVKPAASGTTIDERVFLNDHGGAIAIWGPAGLSVAHGHDKLQEGFFNALAGNAAMNTPIGQLFEAGMQELLLHGSCCQDALQTFVVFGDPLTPARAFVPRSLFLPLVSR